MRAHLKKFFIPHEENDYHPHILHTKRAIFYSSVFLFIKGLVFLFAILLPSVVFVMPDVLAGEETKLLALTNNLRLEKGLTTLSPIVPLHVSSKYKASDMADLHYFSHISPNGYGLAHFLATAGYRYNTAGENLAMGFSSAEEIFSSWVQSPTHYANLIDPEYKEFGVAMESGTYNDLATVYVAQHFGSPKVVAEKPFPKSEEKIILEIASVFVTSSVATSSPKEKEVTPAAKSVVAPAPAPVPKPVVAVASPDPAIPGPIFHIEPVAQEVHLVAEESIVEWKEVGEKTFFSANVKVQGDVQSATVAIKHYSFPLKKVDEGVYHGELLVNESVNNFFKPIVEPSLQIVDKNGQIKNELLSWKQIKVISPTPLEKYTRAKALPGIPEHLFEFSRGVYLFFIGFFSLALILSIVIEIRRQHHHIIAQTLGLILLLISLFVV